MLVLVSSLAALAISALESPAITVKASDSQLRFLLPPTRVESVCANDLFALEQHVYVDSTAWVCFRADPTSGRLNITNWGYLDAFQGPLVRGPVATDRSVIFANGQNFLRLDPLTLEQTIVGTMSPPVDNINAVTVIDVPPGVANAALIDTPMDTQLRTFPGGQFLRTVIPWPLSSQWARQPTGHFLSPDTTLVAVPDNNDGVSLIDPATGAVAKSISNLKFGNWAHSAPRSAAGKDGIVTVAGQYGEQIAVDQFAPSSTIALGSSGDGFVVDAGPVDWTAGEHDVVGMWDYALRVFDPATAAVRYEELLPYDRGNQEGSQIFAVDADGDGLQEVFWTDYDALHFLPHGGPSRELQGPSLGFQVAGITGSTLVTAETSGTFGDQHLDIVFRDARSLEVRSRRTASPLELDSRVLAGPVAGQAQPVLFTQTDRRLAAESIADGASVWELDNPVTSGNDWTAFALPTGACAPDSCARLLVASNAANTNTLGSFLWLLDSATGKTLWQGAPVGGLGGGGYRALALADINGDGVPDIIGARNDSPNGWLVEAVDGSTFQGLWIRNLGNSLPQAVGVSSKGDVRVALLLDGSAELLDATDGHTVASQPVVDDVYADCCSIQYDAFAFDKGIWVILGGAAVQWLDADFAEPVQSIDARGVRTEISRGRGAMFAAGVEGLYRIQFPRDDIFNDDLDD